MIKGLVFMGWGHMKSQEVLYYLLQKYDCPFGLDAIEEPCAYVTQGHRLDLVLEFKKEIDAHKLKMWRLNFPNCVELAAYQSMSHYDEEEAEQFRRFQQVFKNKFALWRPETRKKTELSMSEYGAMLFKYPELTEKYPTIK